MFKSGLLPSLLALAATSAIAAPIAFGQTLPPSTGLDPDEHEAVQPEPVDPAEILAAEAK